MMDRGQHVYIIYADEKTYYEKGEVIPMNNLKEKKLNNKGFSLVELIIVIAIMAVLIGVLAPQYLRYVERSRRSADGTTINEYVDSLSIAGSDIEMNLDTGKTYTVTSAANSDTIVVSADAQTILAKYGLTTPPTLKSADYKAAAISITLAYDDINKIWDVTALGIPTP